MVQLANIGPLRRDNYALLKSTPKVQVAKTRVRLQPFPLVVVNDHAFVLWAEWDMGAGLR